MPKSQRIRETDNPLGQKINAVMAEKGIAGDYAQLAKIFDVAAPSTYDWITHGRLGKERYKRLVEWSGKSLDWWFDIPNSTETSSLVVVAREPGAEYRVQAGSEWPFNVDRTAVSNLKAADLAIIDAYINGVMDVRHADALKRG